MPHRLISTRARSNARSLRRGMTDAERRIWTRLRAHRFSGVSFRRQVPIGPYIADFVCFDARLIIELDGGQHAESKRDHARDSWLRRQGFSILRFWNNDVFSNIDGVLETVANAIAQKIPPSLTLPRKGGGNAPKRGDA
jgi:very-short-patch-repair endonuclease